LVAAVSAFPTAFFDLCVASRCPFSGNPLAGRAGLESMLLLALRHRSGV